ncbi:alpha-L-rhamnosidase N-terminal domain-containing protein [Streptomyces thermocarboxydus]
MEITAPTVEYARHPLGLDERVRGSAGPWPWRAGLRQSAYQLRVATSVSALARPDVWDSGRVTSEESVLVPYEGPELRPRTRYFWTVRVWDGKGRVTPWSEPDWWETGLMDAGQWPRGGSPLRGADRRPVLRGRSLDLVPEGDPASSAPAETRWFRRTAELPGEISSATLVITADNAYSVSVNGREVARTDLATDNEDWKRPAVVDVFGQVVPGSNVIAVEAANGTVGPAGLLAVLVVRTAAGEQRVVTDAAWKVTDQEPSGNWRDGGFDDPAGGRARPRRGPVRGARSRP